MRLVGVIPALLTGVVLLAGCSKQKWVNLFEEGKAQEALTELSKKFSQPAKILNVTSRR